MQNPLSEAHRELLSAYVDGEVTDAEKQTVEELLLRQDAQQYVDSLRATVRLVADGASLRAPVGLSARVMDELKSEFKQPEDPGSESFTTLPRISWQAPIWAAAAAVIVSIAIMFGPNLFNSKSSGPSVARDALDDLPTRGFAQPEGFDERSPDKPETAHPDGVESDAEVPGIFKGMEHDLGEEAKRTEGVESLKTQAAGPLEEIRKDPADSVADKYSPDAHDDANQAEPNGGATRPRKEASGNSEEKADDAWDGGAKKRKGESQGAEPRQPRRDRADGGDSGSSAGRDSGAGRREAAEDELRPRGARVPPAAPAEEPSEAPKQADETIELKLTEGDSLTAQTDVLWISRLFGKATVSDGEEDIESIEAEVDAETLPEFIAALRKLAREQGYGTVEGGASRIPQAEPSPENTEGGEEARRISGYLPAEDESSAESEKRVKLVIRLK